MKGFCRSPGPRPVSEIKAVEILAALRTVEARGRLETARRLRAKPREGLRYALAAARAENGPTGALNGALPPEATRRAAIIHSNAFGALLRAMADDTSGASGARAALGLLAISFARPGELRTAERAGFDLDAAVWTIPADKMKMRRPHRIPLAPRVEAISSELHGVTGGGTRH